MKKLFVLIVLVGTASWTIMSCGSKKEEKTETKEDAAVEAYEAEDSKARPVS